MSGPQNDARCLACFEGFLPPGRTQAPAITWFQAWETKSRPGSRKIIAARF